MKYPKIQSIYKREQAGRKKGRFIRGDWTSPEFEVLQGQQWEATEKIDGTTIRVTWDGEKVTLGGRTDKSAIPATLVTVLHDTFPVEKFHSQRRAPLPPMVIFGEGYGLGINKGELYKPDGVDFSAFDILCGGYWLKRSSISDICFQLDCRLIRCCGHMSLHAAIALAKTGFQAGTGTAQAEGLVLRAPCGMLDRGGNRIITKIKTKDFAKGYANE